MSDPLSSRLADVQHQRPPVDLPIDCVGISGLRFPLRIPAAGSLMQHPLAVADLGVDLCASQKGTHMSRLVESLDQGQEILGTGSMRHLLLSMAKKLEAKRAWARFSFPYLVRKPGPRGNRDAYMAYECSFSGTLDQNESRCFQGISTPVMTVCPCSRAISDNGAHGQRALVHVMAEVEAIIEYEEIATIAEKSASSPVYTLLKREDEKFVTESAFARPLFVEDVARLVVEKLSAFPGILNFSVKVESMESIHNHNAFARISSHGWHCPPFP